MAHAVLKSLRSIFRPSNNISCFATVLNKLKLNIRSMLESEAGKDKSLIDLCLDVIYHPNMKAFGLQQLVLLFINWKNKGNDELGMTRRAFQGTPFN